MKRFLLVLPLLVFVLIGAVAAVMLDTSSSGQRNSRAIGFSMEGAAIPQISMTALNNNEGGGGGGIIRLDDYKGEAFAINIFASWCVPCRLEAPAIDRLSQRLPVIGINYRDSDDDARRFLNQFGNPFTAIGKDQDGNISIQLGVHGLPETFVVGGDGVILYHLQGPLLAREMAGRLNTILQEAGL